MPDPMHWSQQFKPSLAEVRERMDWWRRVAQELRNDRQARLEEAGQRIDQLLDAIEASDE